MNSNMDKDKKNNVDNRIYSSDLSLLTDTQRALIESIRRDYLPQVLKDQGLLKEDNRDKADLMINNVEGLIHDTEFVLKHHRRIRKMELNLIKLWESYTNEIDRSKKAIIHEHLVSFQYYLYAYYFALTDKLSKINTKYPTNT